MLFRSKIVTRRVGGLAKPALGALAASIRDRLGTGVVVLASESEGKVDLLVSVTKDLVGRVHAGRMVKALAPIVGGRGGGRPAGLMNDTRFWLLPGRPQSIQIRVVMERIAATPVSQTNVRVTSLVSVKTV